MSSATSTNDCGEEELSEAKQLQLIEHMEQQINKPKNHSIFMMRQVQYLNITSIRESQSKV